LAHELAESRATLAEREQRLTSLYRSYSWRMTAPVRGVRRLLVGGDTAGQISKSNVDGRG
jgi:hypothetical protein